MNKTDAIRNLQMMHESQTVTRDGIIAWYYFYSDKLPPMRPERSDLDLIRTIALWMRLTDQGASPGFPYDYAPDLRLGSVNVLRRRSHKLTFALEMTALAAGLALLFFGWRIGILFIIGGLTIPIVAYLLRHSTPSSKLLQEYTIRAMQWSERQDLS